MLAPLLAESEEVLMYGFIFAWIWSLVKDWLLWESSPRPQTGPWEIRTHGCNMPSIFHSVVWYFAHNIITKYCSPTFCAGLELLVLANAGLKPAGRGGEGCWGSSSWDLSFPKPTWEPQAQGHGRVFLPCFNPWFP